MSYRAIGIPTSNKSAAQAIRNRNQQSGQQHIREICNSMERLEENNNKVNIVWLPSHNQIEIQRAAKASTRQVVSQHEGALEHVRQRWEADLESVETRVNAVMLFTKLLYIVPGCTFVVDGLDECTYLDDRDTSIIQFLHAVTDAVVGTNTRVLVVSGAEPEIRHTFTDRALISIAEYEISLNDVRSDTAAYSKGIVDRKLSNKSDDLQSTLSEAIIDRYEGQFLWLKVQEKSLGRWMNKEQLQHTIKETPAELDRLYNRSWQRINQSRGWMRERNYALLRFAAFALRPLTVYEVAEAVLINESENLPIEHLPDANRKAFLSFYAIVMRTDDYQAPAQDLDGLQVVPHSQLEVVPSYYGEIPVNGGDGQLPANQAGTIFGLQKATFILSLCLALAVVIIAVVGGVLGSNQTSNCSTEERSPTAVVASTSSSSTTSSGSINTDSFVAPTGATIDVDCSQQNPIQQVWPLESKTYYYNLTCHEDCPGGDLFAIWSYSVDMCVEACVNMNMGNVANCTWVAFRADLSNVVGLGGNCYLKTTCPEIKAQPGIKISHASLNLTGLQ
ncbi:hypothetical protein EDB80DRAFT_898197 [Ilyonectria destructans]|nr:hypothetical protein EDB80DRAFT_898197 [Ilyonectria destructans]